MIERVPLHASMLIHGCGSNRLARYGGWVACGGWVTCGRRVACGEWVACDEWRICCGWVACAGWAICGRWANCGGCVACGGWASGWCPAAEFPRCRLGWCRVGRAAAGGAVVGPLFGWPLLWGWSPRGARGVAGARASMIGIVVSVFGPVPRHDWKSCLMGFKVGPRPSV